jgi:hypothetical protein
MMIVEWCFSPQSQAITVDPQVISHIIRVPVLEISAS